MPSADRPIRSDVDEILRRAFPEGVMAPALDIQKSHLAEVFPRLKKRLLELDGAEVAYERDPLGGSGWSAGDGRLPSEPATTTDRDYPPSSYYLFFLAATTEPCNVGDGETVKIGYSVALSVMAPMALVVLQSMEEEADGFAHTVPDITPEPIDDGSGEEMEIGHFCREVLPAQGLAAVERLREEIGGVGEEFGFRVLPDEEQDKPVPWLQVPAMPFARPAYLSVRDALFFWAMGAR